MNAAGTDLGRSSMPRPDCSAAGASEPAESRMANLTPPLLPPLVTLRSAPPPSRSAEPSSRPLSIPSSETAPPGPAACAPPPPPKTSGTCGASRAFHRPRRSTAPSSLPLPCTAVLDASCGCTAAPTRPCRSPNTPSASSSLGAEGQASEAAVCAAAGIRKPAAATAGCIASTDAASSFAVAPQMPPPPPRLPPQSWPMAWLRQLTLPLSWAAVPSSGMQPRLLPVAPSAVSAPPSPRPPPPWPSDATAAAAAATRSGNDAGCARLAVGPAPTAERSTRAYGAPPLRCAPAPCRASSSIGAAPSDRGASNVASTVPSGPAASALGAKAHPSAEAGNASKPCGGPQAPPPARRGQHTSRTSVPHAMSSWSTPSTPPAARCPHHAALTSDDAHGPPGRSNTHTTDSCSRPPDRAQLHTHTHPCACIVGRARVREADKEAARVLRCGRSSIGSGAKGGVSIWQLGI
eukprot:214562-Chlamydomonas_euryale.AAC.5